MTKKHVFIIGTGNVVKICVAMLTRAKIGEGNQLEITLFNPVLNHAKGVALDAQSSLAGRYLSLVKRMNERISIKYTGSYEGIKTADMILIAAGRYPSLEVLAEAAQNGADREAQTATNYPLIKDLAAVIKLYNPNVFVMMLSNQVDYLTYKFQQLAAHNPKRIVGFGGALDSDRFRTCLRNELEKFFHVYSVAGHMIGYHNNDMFPLMQSIRVNNLFLEELVAEGMISAEKLQEVINTAVAATRGRGAFISELNKNSEGASINAGILLSNAILGYCFSKKPFIGSFTTCFPEKHFTGVIPEPGSIFFSYPVKIENGKVTVMEGDMLTRDDIEKAKTAIKKFNQTVQKTDEFIANSRNLTVPRAKL